ncbi:MAG: S41 family peptidase [Planctomycetota bacterium]
MSRRIATVLALALLLGSSVLLWTGAGPPGSFDAAAFLENVEEYITSGYYDQERVRGREMLRKALIYAEASLEDLIVDIDDARDVAVARVGEKSITIALPPNAKDPEASADAFHEACRQLGLFFEFVRRNDRGDVPYSDVAYATINAFLSPLDPHTNVMSPRIYREFQTSLRGDFFGIGAIIGSREGQLIIVTPLPNSPAAKAGIRAADRVLEIEGESTVNMTPDEAVTRIRGPKDKEVRLLLSHKDGTPFEASIVRQKIEIPSIRATALDGGLAYLRILDFQANTDEQVATELKAFHARPEGLKGLILDLRGNHGGLLDQSVSVADFFVDKGEIVITESRDPNDREVRNGQTKGTEPNYPIVALVDADSASAAEILCGALQRHDRALLLGERTYGKGSVQKPYEIRTREGTAVLKMTISQYLLPGRVSIQRRGVVPDVQLLPARVRKEVLDVDEDPISMREEDYETSLPSAERPPPPPPSPYAIRYLAPELPEDEEDIALYTGALNLERDVSAQIAKAALESVKGMEGFSRTTLLESRRKALDTVRSSFESKIAEALAKRKIDWSEEPDGPAPKIVVKVLEPAAAWSGTAGEPMKIRIEAANEGTVPVRRLRATLKAVRDQDGAPMAGAEALFDAIPPGESRIAEASPTVPPAAATRRDRMRLVFRTDRHDSIAEIPVAVDVESRGRPAFSYEFSAKDANGNGRIEKNERVTISVRVTNEGGAASKETLALLTPKGERRPYLVVGRHNLKDFKPGETRPIEFSFETKEGFADPKAEFDFTIYDLTFGESLRDRLSFPIEAAALPAAPEVRRPPRIRMEAAARETDGPRLLLRGTATDEASVTRIAVTVNGDKALMKIAPPGARELSFDGQVPLQEGMNEIRIIATDGGRLVGRQSLFVRRNPDGAAKTK